MDSGRVSSPASKLSQEATLNKLSRSFLHPSDLILHDSEKIPVQVYNFDIVLLISHSIDDNNDVIPASVTR